MRRSRGQVIASASPNVSRDIDYVAKMQAVLRLSEQFGEEFVVPTEEVAIVRAKRPLMHRFKDQPRPVCDDIEKPI
jgi:hypothetical protein